MEWMRARTTMLLTVGGKRTERGLRFAERYSETEKGTKSLVRFKKPLSAAPKQPSSVVRVLEAGVYVRQFVHVGRDDLFSSFLFSVQHRRNKPFSAYVLCFVRCVRSAGFACASAFAVTKNAHKQSYISCDLSSPNRAKYPLAPFS